jgi:hypothetical protein
MRCKIFKKLHNQLSSVRSLQHVHFTTKRQGHDDQATLDTAHFAQTNYKAQPSLISVRSLQNLLACILPGAHIPCSSTVTYYITLQIYTHLAVIAVEVASAVTVHAGHVAGGGVPHGAVEVVAGALTIEHARGGVVEEARGKVGNAKHLHNIASWAAVRMPVKCHILCPPQCPSIPILPASLAQLHTYASFIPDAQIYATTS